MQGDAHSPNSATPAWRISELGAAMRAAARAGDLTVAQALATERSRLLAQTATDPSRTADARLPDVLHAERAADAMLAEDLERRMRLLAHQHAQATRLRNAAQRALTGGMAVGGASGGRMTGGLVSDDLGR